MERAEAAHVLSVSPNRLAERNRVWLQPLEDEG